MNKGVMLVTDRSVYDAKEVVIMVRNDDKPVKIGDNYGCAKVIRLQAYGKDLQEIGEGMTAAVTFDRMPLFSIVENMGGGNIEPL